MECGTLGTATFHTTVIQPTFMPFRCTACLRHAERGAEWLYNIYTTAIHAVISQSRFRLVASPLLPVRQARPAVHGCPPIDFRHWKSYTGLRARFRNRPPGPEDLRTFRLRRDHSRNKLGQPFATGPCRLRPAAASSAAGSWISTGWSSKTSPMPAFASLTSFGCVFEIVSWALPRLRIIPRYPHPRPRLQS